MGTYQPKKGDLVWVNEKLVTEQPLPHEWWGMVVSVQPNGVVSVKDMCPCIYEGTRLKRWVGDVEPKLD